MEISTHLQEIIVKLEQGATKDILIHPIGTAAALGYLFGNEPEAIVSLNSSLA